MCREYTDLRPATKTDSRFEQQKHVFCRKFTHNIETRTRTNLALRSNALPQAVRNAWLFCCDWRATAPKLSLCNCCATRRSAARIRMLLVRTPDSLHFVQSQNLWMCCRSAIYCSSYIICLIVSGNIIENVPKAFTGTC